MINNKAKKDESRNLCHYQCIFISKLYTEWHFFIVPSSFRRLSINESEMTHIDIIPNLCRFVFGKINRSVHWIQYILSINTTSPMHFFFFQLSHFHWLCELWSFWAKKTGEWIHFYSIIFTRAKTIDKINNSRKSWEKENTKTWYVLTLIFFISAVFVFMAQSTKWTITFCFFVLSFAKMHRLA